MKFSIYLNRRVFVMNVNAYAKFGLMPSIHSQDEHKQFLNHKTQAQNSVPPPHYAEGGGWGGVGLGESACL